MRCDAVRCGDRQGWSRMGEYRWWLARWAEGGVGCSGEGDDNMKKGCDVDRRCTCKLIGVMEEKGSMCRITMLKWDIADGEWCAESDFVYRARGWRSQALQSAVQCSSGVQRTLGVCCDRQVSQRPLIGTEADNSAADRCASALFRPPPMPRPVSQRLLNLEVDDRHSTAPRTARNGITLSAQAIKRLSAKVPKLQVMSLATVIVCAAMLTC
ncbi:hypothetical protein EJ04DRAFT_222594 [Polyplosphaeria fusca]|uniref:Uncharacterized protein n=1 Tax=Polyplosphaeria fusca TaxID=682080 RepID=A0A9P4QW73_9PLEO|nr:hypothetical protein EJ04DRAFT_222594 [Polyplosphaeria fusca]